LTESYPSLSERGRAPRHFLADVAESNDPERLAAELVDAGFSGRTGAPLPGAHVGVQSGQFFQRGQNQHQGVLRHRDGVRAAVVGDGYAGLFRRRHVRLVITGAQQLHQTHLFRRREEFGIDVARHS